MKKSVFFFLTALTLGFSTTLLTGCSDPSAPKSREELIKDMVQHINDTPDWIGGLKKEAEEKKVSLDTLVMKAAVYMIDKDALAALPRTAKLEKIKKNILGTPEWIGKLKKDAEVKKISIDSLVAETANYMLDVEEGKTAQPAPAPAPAK